MRLNRLNLSETVKIVPVLAAGTLLASAAATVYFAANNGLDVNTTFSASCAMISLAALYASVYNLRVWKRSKSLAKTEVFLKYVPGEKKSEPEMKIKYKIPDH